ncbi:hypothetical protein [Nonomuraea basaltis]|uniref:hypothetical protein n=1 Tax=Nonomuraea basaltis TaxID=2495887 RepID=UPI00110C5DA8|nr:hypothetical protein [Nonomuraea basaltis]TMR94104.1 hypothetical protein EJK15_35790 [Nonomuraea basaltis]
MRPIVSAVIVMAMAAMGCAVAGFDTSANNVPQNEGANLNVGGVLHVRNVFLLSGTDPASPAPQQVLYAVLINSGHQPVRLERITVEGGGSVQLAGPVTLPPDQPVGTGGQPIGTVSGMSGLRGSVVPMTFIFSGADPVRVNVPVKTKTGHYANLTPSPGGAPSPTAPPSPSPAGTPSPSPPPAGTESPSPSPTSPTS